MAWTEQHHSTYSTEQLFDLVADVERYPEFLPWIKSAKVFRRKDKAVWTRLTFGMSLIRKNFTTTALLDKPHQISVSSYDALFERFEQLWTFRTVANGGTDIVYRVDLQLNSRVLQVLVDHSMSEGVQVMVQAYMRRADRLYGSR